MPNHNFGMTLSTCNHPLHVNLQSLIIGPHIRYVTCWSGNPLEACALKISFVVITYGYEFGQPKVITLRNTNVNKSIVFVNFNDYVAEDKHKSVTIKFLDADYNEMASSQTYDTFTSTGSFATTPAFGTRQGVTAFNFRLMINIPNRGIGHAKHNGPTVGLVCP